MSAAIVLAGHNLVCVINGRVVGRVTSFRWTRRTTVRRLQGVDQLVASELIRGPVAVSGTIGLLRTRRDGGAEGVGLIPPVDDLTREQYVSLMLRDRLTDTVVARVDQALVESDGWSGDVREVLRAQVAFEGISVVNEVQRRR